MADTIREQIISDLCVRLTEITLTNGYNTDVGQKIERSALKISSSDLPAIDVFPGAEEVETRYGVNHCTFRVRIDALSLYDLAEKNFSIKQEQILGDLISNLTDKSKPIFSTKADSIQYVQGGTEDHPEAEEPITIGTATFEIKYKFKVGNPYQQ